MCRLMCLLALVGISDPPRPEAIASIARCHQAGIRVKMITGDHAVTARAIGAQVGLSGSHRRNQACVVGSYDPFDFDTKRGL